MHHNNKFIIIFAILGSVTMTSISLFKYGHAIYNDSEYCFTTCQIDNCSFTSSDLPCCFVNVTATLTTLATGVSQKINYECKLGSYCDICRYRKTTCYIQRNTIMLEHPTRGGELMMVIGGSIAALFGVLWFAFVIANFEFWIPNMILRLFMKPDALAKKGN